MDVAGPVAIMQSTCPPAVAPLPEVDDNKTRIVGLLDVSQICAAPFSQIRQSFLGKSINSARSYIKLELLIP
jgi:hypothetical protein